MKKTAGRLPSSAGGLYSFGAFFRETPDRFDDDVGLRQQAEHRRNRRLGARQRRLRIRDLLLAGLERVFRIGPQPLPAAPGHRSC